MKKQNVLRILLFVLCAVLSLGLTVGAEEDTATEWNLINYDFDEKPSNVINEGTVADGKLTVTTNSSGQPASFYTAPISPTATQIKSEVAVRALTGWVKVCFTNKISAQGYQVQVRANGDVLLFGGASPTNLLDTIGKYDPATFCKISFEMDLEEDIIRIAINDGEAKEYNATASAYYDGANYDVRGLSRILVVGEQSTMGTAEVDYIRVMSTAAPETSTDTEPVPTEPEGTEPDGTTSGTAAPEPTGTESNTNQNEDEKPSNLGLIIGIVAAVVVVAVVVIVVIKKRK